MNLLHLSDPHACFLIFFVLFILCICTHTCSSISIQLHLFQTLFHLTVALRYDELEYDLVQLQLFPRAILVATAQSDATRIDSLTQVKIASERGGEGREGGREGRRQKRETERLKERRRVGG
jgi:hypothetical protein